MLIAIPTNPPAIATSKPISSRDTTNLHFLSKISHTPPLLPTEEQLKYHHNRINQFHHSPTLSFPLFPVKPAPSQNSHAKTNPHAPLRSNQSVSVTKSVLISPSRYSLITIGTKICRFCPKLVIPIYFSFPPPLSQGFGASNPSIAS